MNTEKGKEMNEEIVSKGITEDYVWHEAKSMLAKMKSDEAELMLAKMKLDEAESILARMKSLQYQFEEFVSVMSKRDKDNKQVIAKLYAENFQMNQEIKDLEEKTKNGPIT